jgi:hypothetical protein
MSIRPQLLLAIGLCVSLGLPIAAHANCARDVQDAKQQVQQIKDARTRQRAEDYLQRAMRELDENDEFECQTAIGELQKLIAPKAAR